MVQKGESELFAEHPEWAVQEKNQVDHPIGISVSFRKEKNDRDLEKHLEKRGKKGRPGRKGG